jgi:solute carrier family 25 phosphate transporter 3
MTYAQNRYTMVKFATFEKTVEYIYKYLGKPKESYGALTQTGISFLGGYIAGIGAAVASHPAGEFRPLRAR